MDMNIKTLLTTLGTIALAGAAAQGAVVFQDTFDSLNEGQLVGQNSWQGTGDALNWTVTEGGWDGAGGYIPGGTQHIQTSTNSGQESLYNTFAGQTGDVLYARITFQDPIAGGSEFFMFGLSSDGSSDANSLAGVYSNTALRARAYDNSSNTSVNLSFPSGLGRGSLYTFVIKAEKTGGSPNWNTATLIVNPDLSFGSSENTGAGSVSATRDTGTDTLSSFFLRTGGSSPASGETWYVDSIAVGTSWGDVTAVPEPATYAALIGLITLGGVALRRRRK
jgi:hypothetical protein